MQHLRLEAFSQAYFHQPLSRLLLVEAFYENSLKMGNESNWADDYPFNNKSLLFSDTNLSETVSSFKGSPHSTDLFQIPAEGITFLFIAYGCICAAALVGNVLVLWLILGARRMWTVTNIFLVNLAVADIVISLFTIPFHFQAALLQRWELPKFLCPVCPFVQALTVLVSVFTLSAIALNRYKVIMNPFNVKTSKKTAVAIIILIWALSVSISLPVYLDFRVIYYHDRNWTVITPCCEPSWLSEDERFYYTQLLVLTQYFVPLLILTWAYARMGFSIWGNETPGNQEALRDAMLQRRKRKVTKMMAGIVTLFGACWFPYQLYNILQPYYPEMNEYEYINIIWFSFHWLAMSNSCCNPFVYAIYNGNFRSEFRRRTSCFKRITMRWVCARRTSEEEMYEMNHL